MKVISNTTPLNYLLLIEQIDLLPQLFDHIMVPVAVFDELRHPRTPAIVRAWAAEPPQWIEIRSATALPSPPLARLDEGERETIALALELVADLVLIDELAGRKEATSRQLRIMGTVGVLDRAAEYGYVDFRESVERLRQTNFQISEALITLLLEQNSIRLPRLADPPGS
jgi:predicted nucleic acid-binding protein